MATGMRLPAMPAKNSDGERRTSTMHEARLELLGVVAHEVRPVRGARNELAQVAHHLAAVADAERERVGAREERGELVARARR